jgi:hypothetical protein
MKKNMRILGAVAVALPFWLTFTPEYVSAEQDSFTFDDIHYWIGDGTNEAAIVIDWNNGKPDSSIAYGYRWNGPSTNMVNVLRQIADEDRRLHIGISKSISFGSSLDVIGYDANGNGGAFELKNGVATDHEDFVAGPFPSHYWSQVHASSYAFPEDGTWGYYWVGIDEQHPENGEWIAYKNINWATGEDVTPSRPVAAETPYGFRIIDFQSDPSLTGGYDFPEAALGRPASSTPADYFGISTPLTPIMGAWGEETVVSLADFFDSPAYIVIEFDHPVVDDPNNPWGLDFIVFGNSFYKATSGSYLTGLENPANIVLTDGLNAEPALVEVSQDGINWYTSDTWAEADSFAPTLGYRLDPANADPSLYDGNKWWGEKTDPTYPVPPFAEDNIGVGTNLAQIAAWYNGSAGGTAYDISVLDLPATHKGMKWFKYVRITNNDINEEGSICEIDAVADIYPDTPFGVYTKGLYDWTELPEKGKKQFVAANGRANFINFALGEDPSSELKISNFKVKNGRLYFSFPVSRSDWNLNDILSSGIELGVFAKSDLATSGAGQNTFGWAHFEGISTNLQDGSFTATISVSEPSILGNKLFFRLGLTAEDKE